MKTNLCAVVFENVISIPSTMQSLQKLSQSAQILQNLVYSLSAIWAKCEC